MSKNNDKIDVGLTAEECLLTVQALADSLTNVAHGLGSSIELFNSPQEIAKKIAEKAKRITQLSQSYADIVDPVTKKRT